MSLKEFIEASRVLAIAHFRAGTPEGKAKLLAAGGTALPQCTISQTVRMVTHV
jgi:hypothetical protein